MDAKAKLAAGLPKAPTTSTPPAGVAQNVPPQAATVPSTPPPTPAALPPVATADPTGILATYRSLTGAEGIRFFKDNEKAIRAARAGVALDAGKFAHLSGYDRVRAAMGIAQP
jgi:hypothetical protein